MLKERAPSRTPTRKLFKQYDPEGAEDLASWRDTFVAAMDLSEYIPAIELAGSWAEWERMKREWPFFREKILTEWKEEIEVRMRSEAMRAVIDVAKNENHNGRVAAAKFILEGKYAPKTPGRPSKEEVTRQARIAARTMEEVDDDIARVQETINQIATIK